MSHSPSSFRQNDEVISERSSPHCTVKLTELASFMSPCELPSQDLPHLPNALGTPTVNRSTLLERREKRLGGSFPSLCVTSLQDDLLPISGETKTEERPVFRGWFETEMGQTDSSLNRSESIRIVSYNILAQRHVSTERYPNCPVFALAEDYRCRLVEQELQHVSPDIILLQEISADVWEKADHLGARLRTKYGYTGEHLVITDSTGRARYRSSDFTDTDVKENTRSRKNASRRVRTEVSTPSNAGGGQWGRSEMEGVATMYVGARFECCETVPILFNKIATADSNLNETERRWLQTSTHNVALITVLRDRRDPNAIYIVGNLHLAWNRTESQLWQLHNVLARMDSLKMKYETSVTDAIDKVPAVTIVLGGDFNSEPSSSSIHYALSGVPLPDSDVVSSWKVPEEDLNTVHSELMITDTPSPTINSVGNDSCTVFSDEPRERRSMSRKRSSITHTIEHASRLHDVYAAYRALHPDEITSVNPSANGEGKVLDYILVDRNHVVCTAVLELSKFVNMPAQNCPSDHCLVGAILLPHNALPLQ
ncbi:putative endonuclease/exonuclease/phosphatase [Trypanosoma vivax]|nr:putative endonuclease/exonuclease/phosphatase [Trypanosoma vivax]